LEFLVIDAGGGARIAGMDLGYPALFVGDAVGAPGAADGDDDDLVVEFFVFKCDGVTVDVGECEVE
jgi:hypothetical protein